MDNKRTILMLALVFVGLMLWNAWQREFPSNTQSKHQQPTSHSEQSANNAANTSSASQDSQNLKTKVNKTLSNETNSANVPNSRVVSVHTDVLNVDIDTFGGKIIKASLPKYPLSSKTPNIPFVLLNNKDLIRYVAPSNLIGEYGGKAFTSPLQYTSQQTSYTLPNGQKALNVKLSWHNDAGLVITKTFTFVPNSYVIGVNYHIDNNSTKTWSGQMNARLSRIPVKSEKSLFVIQTGLNAAYSTPEKPYDKIKFSKMEDNNLSKTVKGGWVAMTQRYFLSAWIPNENQTSHFYTRVNDNNLHTIGFMGPTITVNPKNQASTSARLFIGPEDTEMLKHIAPGLDLTIDYGWLWFISMALFWIMNEIHKVVGNWGWSIVITTIFIKVLFYKLSAKSYRSMARMRKLQPKMQALKERYGDDKQAMSRSTMELYKKEKVNPFGGCLPILVQIPVFIALYWVLIDSVQLRQAPFIFWLHDLSTKDPYFILPVIMGITMFVQQKLNPPPPDPMQAKMMMFLPVVFTFFFLHFPSGLVLYWIVNNSVSILQQWYIMRKVESEPAQTYRKDKSKQKALPKSKKKKQT